LEKIGFRVEVVPTALHPIILAERGGDKSWPHIIIYGHYDVQPADPLDKWTSPAFEPVIRGRRIYARGAADNKGPQAVQFAALAKVFEENPNLPLRVTFLIEGEEEIGSPSFPEFLKKHRDRLREANMVLLSDTGSPNPEQIVITTGLRGLTGVEVTVIGPKMDLHSGIHGGALLNPIQALCEMCASLHAPDGRVNIPGFYDDVREPSQWERDELAKYAIPRRDPVLHRARLYRAGGRALRADAGFQRHRRRLSRRGVKDGHPQPRVCENHDAPGARPKGGGDP
jgi:acetylornithine deacetylase/succinyl-diaminopimelate desuccinylase-like protein